MPFETEKEIHLSVLSRLGMAEAHLFEVWDEETNSLKPLTCSLGDDLGDIYSDIKRGLNAWNDGEHLRTEAIWEWAFNFEGHWGAHAAWAIGAIHSLVFSMPAFPWMGSEDQDRKPVRVLRFDPDQESVSEQDKPEGGE